MNPQPTAGDALGDVSVESPCTVPWAGMRGDDQKRFCKHCRLNVYNLSEMNRAEANAFVRESEGRVCVTFLRRPDGTIVTRDCGDARAATVRRRVLLAAAGALAFLWQGLAIAFNGRIPEGLEFAKERTVSGQWFQRLGFGGASLSSSFVPAPPLPRGRTRGRHGSEMGLMISISEAREKMKQ